MNETTTSNNGFLTEDSYFGRYEFISDSPGLAITSIVFLSIASIIGTLGNLVILIVVTKTKEMQHRQSAFIVNLAISDMYVTLVADPMSIVGKIEGRSFFDQYPLVCNIVGKVCTVSCVSSLGSIAYLSINRYIYICHNPIYNRIFTRWTCIVMCLLLYVVGILLVSLNHAGIGDHSFDDKSLECIWDRMATYSYTVVFSVCLVWLPLIVVGFSYLKLFLFVRHKRKQVLSTGTTKNNINRSLKLSRTIFIVYAFFSLCWIPFAILLVADKNDTFAHELHLCITVFAHFHPSVNWLIYYLTNSNFKKGVERIFRVAKTEQYLNHSFRVNEYNSVTSSHKSNNNLHQIDPISQRSSQVKDLNQDQKPTSFLFLNNRSTKISSVNAISDINFDLQEKNKPTNVLTMVDMA